MSAHWFTGARSSEVVALTVGHVWRNGVIVRDLAFEPRLLKGKRGRTRRVPVSPELRRAIVHQLWWLRLKYSLSPDLPLFPSRQVDAEGKIGPITRVQAYLIIKKIFAAAGIQDDGRLGSHVFRKTVAMKSYARTKDPLLVRDLLNHADIATTQVYLESNAAAVRETLLACDFTRRPRAKKPGLVPVAPLEDNVLPFARPVPTAMQEPGVQPTGCSVY